MSISQIQIEKIKLVRETISALSKVQDTFFGDLVKDLNLLETDNAVDWLFDYCFNEKDSESVEYYAERINKSILEDRSVSKEP